MTYRQKEIGFEDACPLHRRGWEYWRSLPLRPGEDLPHQEDFKLFGLPPEILPTTHLADVLEGGETFRFRFWGSGFYDFFGYDATGLTPEELRPAVMGRALGEVFRTIVESRKPMAMISEFERAGSKRVGFHRFIRLPLAAPDGSVGQIVSMVEFLMDDRKVRELFEDLDVAMP